MPIIMPGGEHLYDETNFRELLVGGLTGTMPRGEHPRFSAYGSIPGTVRFEDVMPPKIPRGEWAQRIAEMDRIGGWATNRFTWAPRNQQQTNFCWANGPCTAAEVAASLQGLPHVEWSAASVACPITGWSNQGGWGADAIEYLVSTGACSTAIWPNAAISRSYISAADKDRPNRKVLEWIDVPPNDFDALATCLLLGFACAVGYDFWSHEVCACRLVQISGSSYGVEIRNSWGSWGSKNANGVDGFSILAEGKGTPDDCQAVRQVTASMEVPGTVA